MKHTTTLLFLFALFSSSVSGAVRPGAVDTSAEDYFKAAKWEPVDDDEGIRTWLWEKPGSDLFAFKAIGVIHQPPGKVAEVIGDITREKEWVPELGDSRVVKKLGPDRRIEYSHFETPFIIKDREFIIDAKISFDAKAEALKFIMRSTNHHDVPPSKYVRGRILMSAYILKPVADGNETEVTFLAHVDPAGSVPRWIVNMFSKGFPMDTMVALRKQAAKSDVHEHIGVKKLYSGEIRSLQAALKMEPQK